MAYATGRDLGVQSLSGGSVSLALRCAHLTCLGALKEVGYGWYSRHITIIIVMTRDVITMMMVVSLLYHPYRPPSRRPDT